MGDLPGEKCKDFQVVKKAKIFQNGEKYEDFSKWSYCNGQPSQKENAKIFWMVKNTTLMAKGFGQRCLEEMTR